MDNIEERFAKMWRKSREDAGKSQEYLAAKLGVSKKTIQNWECGYSCPSQTMGFKWFEALDLPPLPYYLELLYGNFENISPNSSDKECEAALLNVISGLSPAMKRKLLFILYGDYGGSPVAIIDLIVAHLHCPIIARLSIAQAIFTNYEIASAYSHISPHIKPDIPRLKEILEKQKKAIIEKRKSYIGGKYKE